MHIKKHHVRKAKSQSCGPRKDFVMQSAGTIVLLLTPIGLGMLRFGLSARIRAARTNAGMSKAQSWTGISDLKRINKTTIRFSTLKRCQRELMR